MTEQRTNPRPKTPKPKHPGISSELPEKRLERIHKTIMEVFDVLGNNHIDGEEFEIIVVTLRNKFKKLNSNKNFTFEPKLKNVVREEIEKEFKRILDSRGIL